MSRPSNTLSLGVRPSQTPRRTRTTEGTTESNGRVPGRSTRRIAVAASFLAVPLLLTGCSTEWASMSPSLSATKPKVQTVADHTTSTSSPTATSTTAMPSPTSTVEATPDPFAGGELAGGSVQHRQQVGDHSLVIDYWTDGSGNVVHLTAALKGADKEHAVKVTRFAANLESTGTTVPLTDDQGEFVLTPPYSYTTALALPDTEAAVTATDPADPESRNLAVRFDLLVETAPASGAFYRQTVLDTVALNVSSSSEVVSEGAAK